MTQRIFVDASVFVSRTQMDWLFHLRHATGGMYQLHTTNDVLVEALSSFRDRHPKYPGRALRDRESKIRALMDEIFFDFPGDVPFTGQDEGDYHVHAASTALGADLILTDNRESDLTTTPDAERYEVITPDEFFVLIADSAPRLLIPAVRAELDYWSSTPRSRRLDDQLRWAGCPEFAGRVRSVLQHISTQ